MAAGSGGDSGTTGGGSGKGGGAGMAGRGGTSGAGSGEGGGGSGGTCTGAAICGRAVDGIYCARSDGSSALVSHERWSAGYTDMEGWSPPNHFWATIQYPDLNGDGRADVCGRAASGMVCALSTIDGEFTTPTLWLAEFSDAGGWHLIPSYWATIQFPDVNGDGSADVCGRSASGVACALSNGVNGFAPSSVWASSFSDANQWHTSQSYWGTLQFPDVNGDGSADVCARSAVGIDCALSSGTAFGSATSWHSDFADAGGWNSSPSYWKTLQFPDVNGDGASDICARGGAGILCATSNGVNAFGTVSTWGSDFTDANGWNQSPAYYQTIQFPDVNGDGRADVCARRTSGVSCALSSGSSFGALALWAGALSDAAGYADSDTLWATIQYPDLDADGSADVCARSTSGMTCGLSSGTAFQTSSWSTHFSNAEMWHVHPSYALTIQSPNLNAPGCTSVTKPSVSWSSVQRMAPF
jgi:hypothetical protein